MAEHPETSRKVPVLSTGKDFIPGFPTITDFSNDGLKRVAEATKAFQSLPPSGPLWDVQKSYPEFRRAMKNCRTKIEPLIKILLEHELISTHSYGRRTVTEKLDFLVEANDDILERVGTSLDDAEGLFKRAEILAVDKASGLNVLKPPGTWGKKKFGSTSTGGDFRDAAEVSKKQPIIPLSSLEPEIQIRPIKKPIHRVRVIEKPQVKFADTIDNSLGPFVPKLNFKPNSLKPLSILPEYTIHNEEFYGHPYELELNRFEAKGSLLEPVPPKVPTLLEITPLILIQTPAGLESMIGELRSVTEIAVDLEHHSYRTFLGLTCLMQISTRDKDYIIDTLGLWREMGALNEIFTNPKIVKVFHGATSDLEWLQRDFGVYVVGLFDTFFAMKQLNFTHFSLQHLLSHYCSVEVDKKYQLADWRLRPLPEDMLTYARQDTHYLLYIFDLLKNQLMTKNLLRVVYDHSKLACLKRYEKPSRNWQLALRKTRRHLNNRQICAFTELYNWRDSLAREKDESLTFVLPNHMLLTVADNLPKEMTGILACCEPVPLFVHQFLGDLHRIVLNARDLPLHEDKIQWAGGDKRKKQKRWEILVNSFYDMNEDDDFDKVEGPILGDGESLTCDDILVRSSSSIPICSRIFRKPVLPQKSSAYERYELSNSILDVIRHPDKKSNLNLDSHLVQVVRDTLLGEVELEKPTTKPAGSKSKKESVRKVLPEKDYVAFNPMGSSRKRKRQVVAPNTDEDSSPVTGGTKSVKTEESPNEVEETTPGDTSIPAVKSEPEGNKGRKKRKFEKRKWMKKGIKNRKSDDQSKSDQEKNPQPEKTVTVTTTRTNSSHRDRDRASRFFVNPFSSKAKEGKSITFKK